jgi:hypothetical protein
MLGVITSIYLTFGNVLQNLFPVNKKNEGHPILLRSCFPEVVQATLLAAHHLDLPAEADPRVGNVDDALLWVRRLADSG